MDTNTSPAPEPAPAVVPGRQTFRITAIFFIISSLLECFTIANPFPLAGTIRFGIAAVLYHGIYAGLFFGLGIGLWLARPWGFVLLILTSVYYTLDKLVYIFDTQARLAFLEYELRSFGEIASMIDRNDLLNITHLSGLLLLAGWWGFMLYAYLRRAYFKQGVQK